MVEMEFKITGVIIQDGVTNIGNGAFYNCEKITDVILPESITYIGPKAFFGCNALCRIKLPSELVQIEDRTFYNCESLPSINIPDGVSSIGEEAFYGCKALSSIDIPNGLERIENGTFYECESLTSIVISDSVLSIGDKAFYGCKKVENLDLGHGVQEIGDEAFYYCRLIRKIIVPGNVKTIGKGAFKECERTSEIILEEGVEHLGEKALYISFDDYLDKIILPSSIRTIGSQLLCNMFTNVDYKGSEAQRNAIEIAENNAWIRYALGFELLASGNCNEQISWNLTHDGTLTISGTGAIPDYEINELWGRTTGSTAPWHPYGSNILSLKIEEGITGVGQGAFCVLTQLENISLPDSLISIGNYGFYRANCKTLTLPKHLQNIGAMAFSELDYLVEIVLPDSMTSLGQYAFSSTSLRKITIPVSITEIPLGTFYYCWDLIQICYKGSEKQWNAITIGERNEEFSSTTVYYNGNTSGTGAIRSGTCGENTVWKLSDQGVLTISGNGPMADYKQKESSSRNKLSGTSGFSSDYTADTPWYDFIDQINKIVVKSGVTHIGDNAFYNCYHAKSVTLPDSLVSIGEAAFSCMTITSVTIPESVTTLGDSTFSGCFYLNDIQFSPNIKVIPKYCLEYCQAIDTLVLPEGIETIEKNSFTYTLITELIIPASVKTIHEDMGLNSGSGRYITLRFLGSVPESLDRLARAENIRYVYCPAKYYEEYKSAMLPGILKRAAERTCKITTAETPAKMRASSVTMKDENPSYKLEPTWNNNRNDLQIDWSYTEEGVVQVSQDGIVTAITDSGSTFVLADITHTGGKTLAICYFEITYSKINSMLMATLPTNDIQPNYLTTSSSRVSSGNGEVYSYYPKVYVETDLDSVYYQELLTLTNNLTAGCSTDTEKARAIVTWIGKNITYSMKSLCIGETPTQAYAVYYNREGNCQGFSKLAGYMLSLARIPVGIIANEAHMWNIVYLDGQWVMVDAQLGAAAFSYDYSSTTYQDIQGIFFNQGQNIYVVSEPGVIKLIGTNENIENTNPVDYSNAIFGETFRRSKMTAYAVPDGVKSIGYYAFADCTNLKRITIPESVTEIHDTAFKNSKQLTIYCQKDSTAHQFAERMGIRYVLPDQADSSLQLPAKLTTIDSEAFSGLSVEIIVIPETVTEIADDAFDGTEAVLAVAEGSYGESWAKGHEVLFVRK